MGYNSDEMSGIVQRKNPFFKGGLTEKKFTQQLTGALKLHYSKEVSYYSQSSIIKHMTIDLILKKRDI